MIWQIFPKINKYGWPQQIFRWRYGVQRAKRFIWTRVKLAGSHGHDKSTLINIFQFENTVAIVNCIFIYFAHKKRGFFHWVFCTFDLCSMFIDIL